MLQVESRKSFLFLIVGDANLLSAHTTTVTKVPDHVKKNIRSGGQLLQLL